MKQKEKEYVETKRSLPRFSFWKKLPSQIGYTNDFANNFTVSEISSLDSVMLSFEKETTIQFCVVTIDSFATEPQLFDSLVLHISNTWGVGYKDVNNGVTIGISSAYRKIRIYNGYGIEKIFSNSETKKVLDSTFIPRLKKGEIYGGAFNGLLAIMKSLKEKDLNTVRSKLKRP